MKATYFALLAATLAPAAPAAARDRSLPIGQCMNIGNTLEIPANRTPHYPITEADFQRIKTAGFSTVRIPVRWDDRSMSSPPYTVDPAWMTHVQRVVGMALDAGLQVILNSHHFQPLFQHPLQVQPWHTAVWQQIAARFADYPNDRLWFELENEPHDKFDDSNLRQVLDPALAAVRATNPDRPVIIGGQNWSGIDSLATLSLPEDPEVFPTFHYYEPFQFTHQGASWTAPNIPKVGRVYGSDADKEHLQADVAKVRAYERRTGLLPFMGETGAYDKYIPLSQRVTYAHAVYDAFTKAGVSVCQWGYANNFAWFDEQAAKWLPGMLGAIGLRDHR